MYMTKEEMIELLETQEGVRVTHRLFVSDEWMMLNTLNTFEFEDGITVSWSEFWDFRDGLVWNSGWSVFKEEK